MTFDDRRRAFCLGYLKSGLEAIAHSTHIAPSDAEYAQYILTRVEEFRAMSESEMCELQGWRLTE